MLDGMLEYLRVAGRDATPVPVDLNLCFASALDNLRSLVDESHVEVRAGDLPMTLGDELQLLHLCQNLLSNAIKFRGRDRPVIDVSVEARGHQWLLAFRDNGIGIAPPFLERIFTMGQRLHTREEYPGTGIGLALCRRIVERHGGRIWAESTGAGGSTFFVLLPKVSHHGT
jgi:light-regulated signal transduction histidine kinase (bacteriophytochrome)